MVDPGGDADTIMRYCGDWHIRYILITHAHFDHILAAGEVKRRAEEKSKKKTLIALHPNDRHMYDHLGLQCCSFGVPLEQYVPSAKDSKDESGDVASYTLPPPDVELKDGLELSLAEDSIKCKVMHTPGHSQGSCCFLLHHSGSKTALLSSGDTLFCGSVGRSDLPGGDGAQLLQSIQAKLYVLPDKLMVVPGHGPFTTIGHEKKSNPFVRGSRTGARL